MLAIDEHGLADVHRHMGFEPSGRSFDDFTLLKSV